MNFFNQFGLFDGCTNREQETILVLCKRVEYKRNHIIYKQKDDAKYIYFIKNGEIELSKDKPREESPPVVNSKIMIPRFHK